MQPDSSRIRREALDMDLTVFRDRREITAEVCRSCTPKARWDRTKQALLFTGGSFLALLGALFAPAIR